ncbi:peroxisomal membrane protein 11A-like [Pyrus ussuriensis x Pyrus communis]|uniref:Peroxisomal membrane protein 11A-like n=1 Tax=Pyrus ussuriensis x Pyrus communis TaxID=2448454 RepID=A0A5N5HJD2_9ROSA|nr:peroxisomal membrane protein 11A-like [Pyrus ussuriensis x Pyrus communis]
MHDYVVDVLGAQNIVPDALSRKEEIHRLMGLSQPNFEGSEEIQKACTNDLEDSLNFLEKIIPEALAEFAEDQRLGRLSRNLQKISAWAEFIGYAGSISLKFRDLNRISEDEKCVKSSIEIAITRVNGCEEEKERLSKLCEKRMMKRLSVVQDSADALMALADIRDGGGPFQGPLSVSLAGMLSALISTHKNWVSC